MNRCKPSQQRRDTASSAGLCSSRDSPQRWLCRTARLQDPSRRGGPSTRVPVATHPQGRAPCALPRATRATRSSGECPMPPDRQESRRCPCQSRWLLPQCVLPVCECVASSSRQSQPWQIRIVTCQKRRRCCASASSADRPGSPRSRRPGAIATSPSIGASAPPRAQRPRRQRSEFERADAAANGHAGPPRDPLGDRVLASPQMVDAALTTTLGTGVVPTVPVVESRPMLDRGRLRLSVQGPRLLAQLGTPRMLWPLTSVSYSSGLMTSPLSSFG